MKADAYKCAVVHLIQFMLFCKHYEKQIHSILWHADSHTYYNSYVLYTIPKCSTNEGNNKCDCKTYIFI